MTVDCSTSVNPQFLALLKDTPEPFVSGPLIQGNLDYQQPNSSFVPEPWISGTTSSLKKVEGVCMSCRIPIGVQQVSSIHGTRAPVVRRGQRHPSASVVRVFHGLDTEPEPGR